MFSIECLSSLEYCRSDLLEDDRGHALQYELGPRAPLVECAFRGMLYMRLAAYQPETCSGLAVHVSCLFHGSYAAKARGTEDGFGFRRSELDADLTSAF